MKKNLFIYCLVIVCVAQSCRKDTATHPSTLADKVRKSMGEVTAKLNGKDWHSTLAAISSNNKKKTDIIAQHYLNEYAFEYLGFINLSLSKPYTSIMNFDGNSDSTYVLFTVDDDDAVIANYYLDTFFNNYITIDNYSTETGKISGKFQVKLYLESTADKSVYDSVVFTDGVYNLYMK